MKSSAEMTDIELQSEMEELISAGRERLMSGSCAGIMAGSEFEYLTSDERARRHEIWLEIQARESSKALFAHDRIVVRIKHRRARVAH